MATVPKLTYAKIGNKSKTKIEGGSSELPRNQEQKSEDLFSHMNQDNLNYIKKELKMKKNRSDHDRTRSHNQDGKEEEEKYQQQATQRDKLYHKYRGQEEVSEKEPYLQETERRNSQQKPLQINIPIDSEEDYSEANQKQPLNERRLISVSHNNGESFKKPGRKISEDNKMYHSLPYEETKKRVASIEGYCGQAVSTNLNMNRDGGGFMQFLEEYISDLNQSKHLNSKPTEEVSIDKKREDLRGSKFGKESVKNSARRKQMSDFDIKMKEDERKLQRLKRNSDTFGEPNSKYTINSNISYQQGASQLQAQLKQEKLNCLQLAQQVQKLRKYLAIKEDIIKNLEIDNELLGQEVMHLRINQQILKKSKKQIIDITPSFQQKAPPQSKNTKRMNDQNSFYQYENYKDMQSHIRYGSVNPHASRNGHSYRESSQRLKYEDIAQQNPAPLFQVFAGPPSSKPQNNRQNNRQGTPRKDSKSVQRLERQFHEFLRDSSRNPSHLKKSNKLKGLF